MEWLLLLLQFVELFLSGVYLKVLWNLIIVSVFGLPVLTYTIAIALMLCVGVMSGGIKDLYFINSLEIETKIGLLSMTIIARFITFLIALLWIVIFL